MQRNPRQRYEQLRRKSRAPETTQERSLYVLLHGTEAIDAVTPLNPWPPHQRVDPGVEYAYSLFQDAEARVLLEAFLVAGAEHALIRDAYRMGEDAISAYQALFFDPGVFKNDLELLTYIRRLPLDEYRDLLYQAYHEGPQALRWHLCRDKGMVDPTTVLQNVMTDAYFRAIGQRGRPVSSKIAREAAKSAALAIACARTLRDQSQLETGSVDDIRFQFVDKIEDAKTAQDLQATGIEIAH